MQERGVWALEKCSAASCRRAGYCQLRTHTVYPVVALNLVQQVVQARNPAFEMTMGHEAKGGSWRDWRSWASRGETSRR